MVDELRSLVEEGKMDAAREQVERALIKFPKNCALLESRLLISLASESDTSPVDAAHAYQSLCAACGEKGYLRAALRHGSSTVRKNAVRLIGQFGTTTDAKAVRSLIEDSNTDVRKMAVRCLGQLRDAGGVFSVRLAMKDPAWSVRGEAVMALPLLGQPDQARFLFPMLSDRDEFVRHEARQGLLEMIHPENKSAYEAEVRKPSSEAAKEVAEEALLQLTAADTLQKRVP